jgi:hypothetical protein
LAGPSTDTLPEEFIDFMSYCRDLKFEEKPDYNYLRRIFKNLFNREGYEYDYVYDWCLLDKKNRKKNQHANLNQGQMRNNFNNRVNSNPPV